MCVAPECLCVDFLIFVDSLQAEKYMCCFSKYIVEDPLCLFVWLSSICWSNFLGPRWGCYCVGATSANQHLDNFCVPVMLCATRNTVYPVSQSPNTKPALGSLLSFFLLKTRLTRRPQPIRYFLFFSSLFFILYPIKVSGLPPHFIPLHKVLKFVSPKLSSLIIF